MMTIHGSRKSHGRNHTQPELLLDRTAIVELGLKRLKEWRASRTAPEPAAPCFNPGGDDSRHRNHFAKAMARAELGRAYWDERLQRAITKSPDRKPKPDRKTGR